MLEQMQASALFSIRRAVFTYCLAFLISFSDRWLIQVLGINTPEELLIQTLVHGTGFYLGYTFTALVTRPTRSPH
ncbi:hypothetical protein SAMN04489841_3024 [Natrinema salaciae]|uniref:Uncharacterized protein n=1 Tax=Natrinema salaciae TaxID=1186196 RepID=A0A1H9LN84_9EURY|nr:hypothetical protein SAMN04489841_3024 [Natrinema salaciae]